VTYDGAAIWTPTLIGEPDPQRCVRGYMRVDLGAWRCAWHRCEFRIEHSAPMTVSAAEILAHAREHGVEA